MPERPIEEVLREHTDSLMALPGVVGVAQGDLGGRPCIRLMVARKTTDLLEQIPGEIEGHPVTVDETGEFRALDGN